MRTLAFILLAASCCFAQPAPGPTRFDVASVKLASRPNPSPIGMPPAVLRAGMPGGPPALPDKGNFRIGSISLKVLLPLAYDLPPSRIVVPAWLEEETYYEIDAKIPPGANPERVRLMLQNLHLFFVPKSAVKPIPFG